MRPAPSRARLVGRLLLSVALCSSMPDVGAETAVDSSSNVIEQRVKAASLFRFLSYVEWPSGSAATEPYRIGVMGADDVARELEAIAAGRLVNARTVVVRRLEAGDPVADIDELYLGARDAAKWTAVAQRLQNQPVLIVASAEGALAQGAMINFRVVDDHVRFEVALDTVEQANLRVSSRMLSVALQVTRGSAR